MAQMKPFDGVRTHKPRPVTERYLQNAAIYYLSRYASSAANLAVVLERKVRRRNDGHAASNREQADWIAAVVKKCLDLGLVNDTEYARTRALSLHSAGKSLRMIEANLRQKGVEPADIKQAIGTLKEEKGEGLEVSAAISYAKRRRFGPFRTRTADADKLRRELAAFARAGFGYTLAKKIVEASSVESLEVLSESMNI